MVQQLTFDLRLQSEFSLDNFYPGSNHALLAAIDLLLQGEGEMCTYLWGQAGSGRSHLLQAVVKASLQRERSTFYLSLSESDALSPELCQGLESLALICLDDIDAIADKPHWQEAVFHLYNRLQANGHQLLVSATCPPRQLRFSLPDLSSRLGAGLVYQLHALSDDDKLTALINAAAERGMQLQHEVADYILRRAPRDMNALMAVIDTLDKTSLALQRKLTIPFVKAALHW